MAFRDPAWRGTVPEPLHGGAFSPLEAVCNRSFLGRGHAFRPYSYQDVTGVPAGCERADAREILLESGVFSYPRGLGQGMYAGFADLFRYKLLLVWGGWWVDTDVVCPTREPPDAAVSLAREDPNQVNIAIMHLPAGHPAMRAAYERAMAAGQDIAWGDTGPPRVTEIVVRLMLEPLLAPAHAYYPVRWSEYTAPILLQQREWVAERVAGATFLHLWSEMLRPGKYDKSVRPPQGSYLHDPDGEHGMLDGIAVLDQGSTDGTSKIRHSCRCSCRTKVYVRPT